MCATVEQIRRLEAAGCEIVRVAVPDEASADAIQSIKQSISIPLIADIHFNHRLAVSAVESGADGLRINPGNIGNREKIRAVVDCARAFAVPIRIGVNSGSLEKELLQRYGGATPEAMVESALRNVELLASFGFDRVKVSIKASDVARTVEAYRLFSSKTDIPVHLGVTEAGGLFPGIVKSSLGIGMLLAEGIGDTIRVSLTRDPVEEVQVSGPVHLSVGEVGLYTATYTPITATAPVTLTWDNGATGPTAVYSWTDPGIYTVTVTATNPCGEVQGERGVTL